MGKRINLDRMVFPPGRKPGVKLDKRKPWDRCNSIRGQIEIIPEKYWEELAKNEWHQDRRSRYRYTLDQDGVGSCAAEAGCAAKAACDERQGLPRIVYNPWGTYHTTSGGVDRGSSIGDNVQQLRDVGAFPEEVWPRSKGWRAKPNAEAYRVAKFFRLDEFFYAETRAELVSGLFQGFDAHGGYSGHSVAFDRYLGRGKLEFKNSWGDWGDDGFGELSLDRVYFPYGVYLYKNVIPWTADDWSPSLDQTKLAMAVRLFGASTIGKRGIWTPRREAIREEMYKGALAQCGLSI